VEPRLRTFNTRRWSPVEPPLLHDPKRFGQEINPFSVFGMTSLGHFEPAMVLYPRATRFLKLCRGPCSATSGCYAVVNALIGLRRSHVVEVGGDMCGHPTRPPQVPHLTLGEEDYQCASFSQWRCVVEGHRFVDVRCLSKQNRTRPRYARK
jgi:hypothetical protein